MASMTTKAAISKEELALDVSFVGVELSVRIGAKVGSCVGEAEVEGNSGMLSEAGGV